MYPYDVKKRTEDQAPIPRMNTSFFTNTITTKIDKEDSVMFELTPFVRGNRAFAAYDPFKEMEELEKHFFGRQVPAFKTDIRETEDAYILEAELPGFSKEDIRAEVRNGYLTIHADRKTSSEEKDEKSGYIRRERSYGSFTRSFDLAGIQSDNITASYKDGILSLTLPKVKTKTEEGRQLEIQ